MIISIIILILIILLSFSKCSSKRIEHFNTDKDINTRVNELARDVANSLLVKADFDNFKTANDSRLNAVELKTKNITSTATGINVGSLTFDNKLILTPAIFNDGSHLKTPDNQALVLLKTSEYIDNKESTFLSNNTGRIWFGFGTNKNSSLALQVNGKGTGWVRTTND
jgi:hypothetical protein